MRSPVGRILVNIFLGHFETSIPEDDRPSLYPCYVDMRFLCFCMAKIRQWSFFAIINRLHPFFQFTVAEGVNVTRSCHFLMYMLPERCVVLAKQFTVNRHSPANTLVGTVNAPPARRLH